MCSPILMIGTAGLLVSAYGISRQQQASNDSSAYQAAIADRNAQIANMQADAAKDEGKEEISQLQQRLRLVTGQQRAGYAGAGVLVDDGSALDAVRDTAYQGEVEALRIENNAARKAWSYGVSAGNYQAQSNMATASQSSAFGAGATSFLSGASGLATSYLMAKAR